MDFYIANELKEERPFLSTRRLAYLKSGSVAPER